MSEDIRKITFDNGDGLFVSPAKTNRVPVFINGEELGGVKSVTLVIDSRIINKPGFEQIGNYRIEIVTEQPSGLVTTDVSAVTAVPFPRCYDETVEITPEAWEAARKHTTRIVADPPE